MISLFLLMMPNFFDFSKITIHQLKSPPNNEWSYSIGIITSPFLSINPTLASSDIFPVDACANQL
jgi:hypothetical protein